MRPFVIKPKDLLPVHPNIPFLLPWCCPPSSPLPIMPPLAMAMMTPILLLPSIPPTRRILRLRGIPSMRTLPMPLLPMPTLTPRTLPPQQPPNQPTHPTR